MTPDLTPWLNTLSNEDKKFFNAVFSELTNSGFELENPSAVEDGDKLSFKRGCSRVVADQFTSFPRSTSSGVSLWDETEAWEAQFHHFTPTPIVIGAIRSLS